MICRDEEPVTDIATATDAALGVGLTDLTPFSVPSPLSVSTPGATVAVTLSSSSGSKLIDGIDDDGRHIEDTRMMIEA
jgi:hypothetical protein